MEQVTQFPKLESSQLQLIHAGSGSRNLFPEWEGLGIGIGIGLAVGYALKRKKRR